MSVVPSYCPHCRAPLSSTDLASCPQCQAPLRDRPTLTLGDLNTTSDFRIPASGSSDDELVGRRLAHYRIERFLGQGGMARVYQATHLTLERPCAIKVLRSGSARDDEDAAALFLAEARAAAGLVHPHVVTIHTIGVDGGRHFIEMEYVEGRSLETLVAVEGQFDPTDATHFMLQIGLALALAHGQGMVHRDIKPANVLVTRDRSAKLADFGLAKKVHQLVGEGGQVLTGTPNYMAPELFAGSPADKRSDIYAMGVSYFQLLTGRLPRSGNSLAELIEQHRCLLAPDVREIRPEVPDNACRIVQRCLEQQPDRRYECAGQLVEELRAAYGSLRSLGGLLQEALRGTEALILGAGDRFEVVVPLPGERRQRVAVELGDGKLVAEQVIRISSICGPAQESHFLRALQLNPKFPYGAIGIESVGGVLHFVMTNVYPRATCDPEEIRHSVLGIASHADEAERWLSHEDVH